MGDNNPSGTEVIKNFMWSFLERWGAQGVTFIVSIILARKLDPSVYGIVAMASIFTSILSVFIDSGLGSALVQKKDVDEYDFSSVFYFNIIMCSVLYIAMFALAPIIADYYVMPELTAVIRVSSLSLVIAGFKNILISVIQRNLEYKKFFFSTLAGTIAAAIVGISMAYAGFGVWALVCQGLCNSAIDTIILWITVKWRPIRYFSIKRIKGLLTFGTRMLGATLINTVYNKLRDLIIGKKYSPSDLAYYNKASGWPNLLFVNISGAVDSVMFPTMSRAQDDKDRVKSIMSRTIRLNTYVVYPLVFGLAIVAGPAISIILTDKWLPMVLYMRIFCISCAIKTIDNTQINMVRSIGRSDWFFRLGTIKRIVDIIGLIITMNISVKAMAYSLLVTQFIGLCFNIVAVRCFLNYSVIDQLNDFVPNTMLSLIMVIGVFFVIHAIDLEIVQLIAGIVFGVLIYILASIFTKNENFAYIKNGAKKFIKR